MKRYGLIALILVLIIVLSGCLQSNKNLNSAYSQQHEHSSDPIEEKQIANLAEVWANALKTRYGKPRYDMMSQKAKLKFEQEQILRSGENWNFNIGDSSPWVDSYTISLDGMTAYIVYAMKTSEPANYTMSERVTFIKEDGALVVDDYDILSE